MHEKRLWGVFFVGAWNRLSLCLLSLLMPFLAHSRVFGKAELLSVLH